MAVQAVVDVLGLQIAQPLSMTPLNSIGDAVGKGYVIKQH